MVLACIGLLWLLYRLGLPQITAQADLRCAERLEERTRIARELHDTMLQSLQASLLHMHAARNLFSRSWSRPSTLSTVPSGWRLAIIARDL
jgi:hypothetical protein